MRIADIETHLTDLKNRALQHAGVSAELALDIHLANPPSPEMGDRGFPCFSLARVLRKAPALIASEIATGLQEHLADDPLVSSVEAAGPYVNFRLHPGKLARIVVSQALNEVRSFGFGHVGEHWMIEFSAPNTNKPQHLGHVRNNLLGDAISRILDAAGNQITRVNLINDRGIHICKSMLAYELFGSNETPENTGLKGDHFVGKYYVLFNQKFEDEYHAWLASDEAEIRFQDWLQSADAAQARKTHGEDPQKLHQAFQSSYKDKFFNHESELGQRTKAMLRQWEDGNSDVLALWQTMNAWVFDGFNKTYERMGIEFDKVYLESQTYKLGKEIVEAGLESGKFQRLDDGAVVCNLEPLGLNGQKVLLRSDGTSVYMTQDLGTALARFEEFQMDRMAYVVGDEQQYHFEVLFKILALLRPELEGHLHHLSYGMVELPDGKMKSREGKVVDADDLLSEMEALARDAVQERFNDLAPTEIDRRARHISLAALKYFILDYAPRTTVHFDPNRSIDFQGRTGPYCLYSYARISSIKRRLGAWPQLTNEETSHALLALNTDLEIAVVRQLQAWPGTIDHAARNLNPSSITEALFQLAKSFSTLYNDTDHRIIDLDGPRKNGLLLLAQAVQHTLGTGLSLLGIEPLEEM